MERAYTKSPEELARDLNTSLSDGLSSDEAKTRLSHYGLNRLKEIGTRSFWSILLAQFTNFLVIILLLAALFSFFLGDTVDSLIILAIVILNASIGFSQEYQAEKTLYYFNKFLTPNSLVYRDHTLQMIPAINLVPGDLILIEEGQKVPADIRLISANDLSVVQAVLTGESVPAEKSTETLAGNLPLADQTNMLFSGTIIASGKGKGLVVATNMDTEIGKVLYLVMKEKTPLTPMQEKLDQLGRTIGKIILVLAAGIGLEEVLLGQRFGQALLSAVAIAVAAIPEGLPAIVTISLALGAKKLFSQNALIRNLPAAETLGSTDVICADKTGTLTQGMMEVEQIYINNQLYQLKNLSQREVKTSKALNQLFLASILASNAQKSGDEIIGDPTEAALIKAAEKLGFDPFEVSNNFPRTKELLFTTKRKMMSVISQTKEGKLVTVKGALEAVLSHCAYIEQDHRMIKLSEEKIKEIYQVNEQMAGQALRVIAFAYKHLKDHTFKETEAENDLVFLGLQGMADPPRPEVKETIAVCQKEAGIKVVMITGDHLLTAHAIAQQIGIEGKTITGPEIDRLSDEDLKNIVEEVGVYARLNPEHKLRIIKALKSHGHQVAMTGDGVNDAPALKAADIGVSMGKSGTDVAKDISDIILLDDHFKTIVAAIKEGRIIYDNVRKFVNYLLTSNTDEVLVIFFALALGWPLPLLPIQLLWINLVTDGLPAVAISADPGRKNIMQLSPLHFKGNIINRQLLKIIVMVSILVTASVLSIFNLYQSQLIYAQTMVFTAIVIFDLVRIFAIRFEYGLHLFSNRYLILAVISSLCLQLAILYLPLRIDGISLQAMFKIQPLLFYDWLIIAGFSAFLLLSMKILSKLALFNLADFLPAKKLVQ